MPRILLVDDDIDHLTTFTMILEEAGYSVDKCTGSDARFIGIQAQLLQSISARLSNAQSKWSWFVQAN